MPADLVPIIVGVFGLDDRHVLRPHPFALKNKEGQQNRRPTKSLTLRLSLQSSTIFPTKLDGSKQCIAIIELGGGYKSKDIDAYFKELGMLSPKITTISVNCGRNHPGGETDNEVVLDIEAAGSIAPKAKVAVYFAPNKDKGFIDAINNAVHDKKNNPTMISISWGAAEKEWTPQAMNAMDQAFQAAAVIGLTIFCAAGDDGSRDNEQDNLAHADFPASSSYTIGCGGTKLYLQVR